MHAVHSRGRLATMRLRVPGEEAGGVVADLLFASSGIEPEVAAEAEPLEVMGGVVLPVARTGHLLALEVLALDVYTVWICRSGSIRRLEDADGSPIRRVQGLLLQPRPRRAATCPCGS